MEFAAHAALSNTKEGSKKNIEYHYDAGNAFYKLFLDETMLYSSGIHQPLDSGPCTVASALGAIPEDDFEAREKHLESAQYAKIDAMIDRLGLDGDGSGQSVLEIGCGWGTCAIRMATRYPGLRVTGLTISNEQFAEARARVKAAGMQDRVDIVMRDYRDEWRPRRRHIHRDARGCRTRTSPRVLPDGVGCAQTWARLPSRSSPCPTNATRATARVRATSSARTFSWVGTCRLWAMTGAANPVGPAAELRRYRRARSRRFACGASA